MPRRRLTSKRAARLAELRAAPDGELLGLLWDRRGGHDERFDAREELRARLTALQLAARQPSVGAPGRDVGAVLDVLRRGLASRLHPDRGGDAAVLAIVNDELDRVLAEVRRGKQ